MFYLLLEDGGRLTLEDGTGHLLLELDGVFPGLALNTLFVQFRDKRTEVLYRDKMTAIQFRDKRTEIPYRDKRTVVPHREKVD